MPVSKVSPGHPWQCFRADVGAGHCLELLSAQAPGWAPTLLFPLKSPECLACSHLHLEKLPLKWFPKSSAGNYPSSCWYKAEWAVPAATKAAHAERPASLFESWIGQLLGRGLGLQVLSVCSMLLLSSSGVIAQFSLKNPSLKLVSLINLFQLGQ